MTTSIQKWGNGLAFRIPNALAKQICVELGDKAKLQVESGILKIRPMRPQYDLTGLVNRIKPANRHDEIVWGKAEVREL